MTLSTTGTKPKIGLLQFPGSNCDIDCILGLRRHYGIETQPVWHNETTLPALDGVIIPGGFSYGDYLRGGAIASHSPIVEALKSFVQKGGPVIGICNGFQILTESHILPGVLLRNDRQKFICEYHDLSVAPGNSIYHKTLAGKTLSVPIAHGEGRYYIDDDGLKSLQDNEQIVFKYSQPEKKGGLTNPNGSVANIAGISSKDGRVLGMMPHPERAMDQTIGGSDDGKAIWEAFLAYCS